MASSQCHRATTVSALVLCTVACALQLTGFCIPKWWRLAEIRTYYDSNMNITGNLTLYRFRGLWEERYDIYMRVACKKTLATCMEVNQSMSAELFGNDTVATAQMARPDWFEGIKAIETIGVILGLAAIPFLGVWMFKQKKDDTTVCIISRNGGFILSVNAGCFDLLGVVILLGKTDVPSEEMSWPPALCAVAGSIHLLSAVVIRLWCQRDYVHS